MKRITLDQVRRAYEPKRKTDSLNKNIYLVRKPSLLLTPYFVKAGLSANIVTSLSLVAGVVSGILLASSIVNLQIIAWFGFYFAHFLDCVDGNIARTLSKTSHFGKFFDGTVDTISGAVKYICLGIAVALNSEKNLVPIPLFLWASLGGLASSGMILNKLNQFRLNFANLVVEEEKRKARCLGSELPSINIDQGNVRAGVSFLSKLYVVCLRLVMQFWRPLRRVTIELEWPFMLLGILFALDIYACFFIGMLLIDALLNLFNTLSSAYEKLNYRRHYLEELKNVK